MKNAARVLAGLTKRIVEACSIAHEPTGFGIVTKRIGCGVSVMRRQKGQLGAPSAEERIGGDEKGVRLFTFERCKGRIDLVDRTSLVDLNLQSNGARGRFHVSYYRFCIGICRVDEHRNTKCSRHQRV